MVNYNFELLKCEIDVEFSWLGEFENREKTASPTNSPLSKVIFDMNLSLISIKFILTVK